VRAFLAGGTVPGLSAANHAMPTGWIGADGLCRCDALPDPHDPGLFVPDESLTVGGIWCETALTGPRISPHLFPRSAIPPTGVTSAPKEPPPGTE
jgi:hypothetical protein